MKPSTTRTEPPKGERLAETPAITRTEPDTDPTAEGPSNYDDPSRYHLAATRLRQLGFERAGVFLREAMRLLDDNLEPISADRS